MEQYKLIKKYPLSYELGDTAKIELLESGEERLIFSNDNIVYYGKKLIESIRNSPEYWQIIEEKDYEILKYNSVHDDGFNDKEILSVKRLSDGDVFSIGDETDKGIIKEITINQYDKLSIGITTEPSCLGIFRLNEITHKPKPILTTEDGVDIFDNNCYLFGVEVNNLNSHIGYMVCPKDAVKNRDKYIWFYNDRNTYKYIEENKPIYSLRDIEIAFSKSGNYLSSPLYNSFITALKDLKK